MSNIYKFKTLLFKRMLMLDDLLLVYEKNPRSKDLIDIKTINKLYKEIEELTHKYFCKIFTLQNLHTKVCTISEYNTFIEWWGIIALRLILNRIPIISINNNERKAMLKKNLKQKLERKKEV